MANNQTGRMQFAFQIYGGNKKEQFVGDYIWYDEGDGKVTGVDHYDPNTTQPHWVDEGDALYIVSTIAELNNGRDKNELIKLVPHVRVATWQFCIIDLSISSYNGMHGSTILFTPL